MSHDQHGSHAGYQWFGAHHALDLNGPTNAYEKWRQEQSDRPIAELIIERANRHPDTVAVTDGSRSLTLGQLCAEALGLAAEISRTGSAGEPIAVLLPNDARYPIAVLACLAAGRPCVLLDQHYPEARNRTIIGQSGATAIIAARGAAHIGRLPVIPVSSGRERKPASVPLSPLASDAPAVIIYTSGSTGIPNGIALSQQTILHRAGQLIDSLHFGSADKSLPLGSPCTIAGALQMIEALLSGAVLIRADVRRVGLNGILRTIERERITTLFGTPALLRALCRLRHARARLATLRCLHPSGDVLLSADVELFRTVLPDDCLMLTAYGLTEAPAICQWFVPGRLTRGRVPVGYPLPGYEWTIQCDTGEAAKPGETGELIVRSRFTATGEWRGGELLPGPLRRDPSSPALSILRTGDLARLNGDSTITVMGRKDRQVQINGMRVEPYELECSLREVPGVIEAAVIPRGEGSELSLVAFVVLSDVDPANALTDVRKHLTGTLPSHMWPASIIPIDSLPLLPGYKIDVEALLKFATSQLGTASPIREVIRS